jgi:D-tyrosyl-tRNA(Tyr) deacylase
VRVVVQRVTSATVTVGDAVVGAIGAGLLLLVGAAHGDGADTARRVANKVAEMRIFADESGRFDRSLVDTGGSALVVSQFTLLADVRKGRRPSFTAAAAPELAEPIIEALCEALTAHGIVLATGVFGAKMSVALVNDGPVTFVVDSEDLDRPRRA